MSGRVAGLACLVTGSTGIGAAVSERLVAEGARVLVASRTADHARDLAERLAADGGRAEWMAVDLSEEAGAAAAVAAVVEAFGRLDAVFSVAGGSGRRFGDGPVDALSGDAFDRTIALNLRSQALVGGAATRQMLAQVPRGGGRGSIVLVSSVLATHPVPELFATHAYAAAKGGIDALARAMAATYARHGIRVNVLAPGLTETPMAARAAADEATTAFAAIKQPLVGGFVAPGDVAEAALFLLSDEARAITGQVLAVDGGWSVVAAGAAAAAPT
ncbi:MAG TPA: SDR family NAD(P)-dependent oxidoreductase [Candidatus Limnocylindrales bacterium]|nr:SDR family NAD(P)-dependent oxidoreductase [Candidatus Limnocylindrales bacterium]